MIGLVLLGGMRVDQQATTSTSVARAGVSDVVDHGPQLASDFLNLYVHPRAFAQDWKDHPDARVGGLERLAWMLALLTLIFALYRAFTGTSLLTMPQPSGLESTRRVKPAEESAPRPQLLRISLIEREVTRYTGGGSSTHVGTAIGVTLPESSYRSPSESQLMVFQVGFVHVYIKAVPAKFKSRVLQTAGVLYLALSTAAFLHPMALLLGDPPSFGQTFDFTIVLFSNAVLMVSLVMFGPTVILRILRRRKVAELPDSMSFLLAAAAFITNLVVMVAAFASLFEMSLIRCIVTLLGGIAAGSIASFLTTPLIFAPILYILLRYQNFWDSLF